MFCLKATIIASAFLAPPMNSRINKIAVELASLVRQKEGK
jgi:hypothetical protein